MITCKTDLELRYMREAGLVIAKTFAMLKEIIRPGITTKELDRETEKFIVSEGAKPAFKGLYGFPASICASVNEEVVHGIPGLRKLENGDIISIDVGTEINGYFGDAARTFPVGTISDEAADLLKTTEEALYAGISMAVPGNRLSDISHAVQNYAESKGFSVVRDYVGHGIGRAMHEDPQVPNFGRPGRGPRLQAGMTLAIEPMINLGTFEVETLPDNWTVVTKDHKLSAHFENTIAITGQDPLILTEF